MMSIAMLCAVLVGFLLAEKDVCWQHLLPIIFINSLLSGFLLLKAGF
jgi:hypothetical protein